MNELFTAPNRKVTKIPMDLLDKLPIGYFAVRIDGNNPFTFMRCSRPASGKWKGWIKIQSQHGEQLKPVLSIKPSGELMWWNMSVETELLIACVDPKGAMIAYGREMERCCRCNKELTDERSRWYAIGPECEKVVPEIIEFVGEEKGHYEA